MLVLYSEGPNDLMIGGNYQLITDVGLPTMFSIYCTQGKWFDADYIKIQTTNIRDTIGDPNNWNLLLVRRYGNNEPAVM